MIKEVIALGKDITEAQENARAALGASELDDVKFEVLHMGSRGIFGVIGVKPAQVRAYIEVEVADREPRRQRHEKPKKTGADVESAAPAASEAAEESAPKHKKNRRRKKGGKKQSAEAIPTEFEAVSKPKSEVIPEAELKMEQRFVTEGEDMPYDFINRLIADIGINATAELYSCEDGTRRITIKGDDASILIGHHGDTLDALQYLANLASTRKNANGERDKSRVTIDIEGYRAKREDTLRALARRMAAKAIRNRRSVMLEPMTPYERRIIHSEIQGIEGVSTNSVGSDGNRKIVIFLTDKKPKGIFEEEKPATSLKTEFAQDSEDFTATVAAIEPTVTSDDELESETVTLEQTHPAGDYTSDAEEEDIK